MKQEQLNDRFKYKEKIKPEKLCQILRQWADSIENQDDLNLMIGQQEVSISSSAFKEARIEAEFELKNGEYELEIEMKWNKDLTKDLRRKTNPNSHVGLKKDTEERYQ